MRSPLFLGLVAYLALPRPAVAGDVKVGVVAATIPGCAWFAVADSMGSYTVVQDFFGKGVTQGEQVVGELHSFGFKDYRVGSRTIRVWVDNYFLGKQATVDKLLQKCS